LIISPKIVTGKTSLDSRSFIVTYYVILRCHFTGYSIQMFCGTHRFPWMHGQQLESESVAISSLE